MPAYRTSDGLGGVQAKAVIRRAIRDPFHWPLVLPSRNCMGCRVEPGNDEGERRHYGPQFTSR